MRNRTELDPCLAGCEAALAEAELLLAMLDADETMDEALAPVRRSITALRREVDRLRGLKVLAAWKPERPNWMDLSGSESPWAPRGADLRHQPKR